ncbi:hypothetical protein H6F98_07430 [Microcoleus sp. FACHB-SPT15]|uniref:hypothetical protein n=1 Tax=Microcoleus sp. FACHB-SPT15 TaxID=2692830 RepID=UPI001783314D|nr:hypothetical protein [Microcoleus sp. FACHB-SPT15]MBD1805279.1 hypothetical protein [Microcoleus sp. FACHB-SPT15]
MKTSTLVLICQFNLIRCRYQSVDTARGLVIGDWGNLLESDRYSQAELLCIQQYSQGRTAVRL